MATPFVLKSAKVYVAEYDFSSYTNQVSLSYEYPEVECTAFGDTCRDYLPGIPNLTIEWSGHAASDDTTPGSEDFLAADIGTSDIPITIGATGADVTPGYFCKVGEYSRTLGGSVGDMYGFTAKGTPQGTQLVRGKFLAPAASRTSSSTGTINQLGAVSATQSVYAILHVFSASGTSPTLDVIVESDEAVGFSSGATKITFTQASAATSEWKSAAGAITDTYWRVGWTIGGSDTPTFNFAVIVGII